MNHRIRGVAVRAALLLTAALPRDGWSKVAFTGYAAANYTGYSDFLLKGPATLLAPAGLTSGDHIRSAGFAIDAVGLFATTKIAEDSTFSADITYRTLGSAPAQTRIQYAYLETGLPGDVRLQAGRMLLPFGYYNTHSFYPFQRTPLSAPFFQSSILGLPIADSGAMVSRIFDLGPLLARVQVYGVNGYGSVPTSTSSFRNASLPQAALSFANNLGSSNNNTDVAMGGQVALLRQEHGDEVGASFYQGFWDRNNENLLRMYDAHAHLTPFGFDFLAEALHLDVRGDQGFASTVGSPHWTTSGGFVQAAHSVGRLGGLPLTLYGRGENYWSKGVDGNGEKESARGAAGGFSLMQNENISWKAEYYWIDYRLPFGANPSLQIRGWRAQLGMVLTF